jgi:ferrous iron transport protein A
MIERPLTLVGRGETVILSRIEGGQNVQQRLTSMGLHPGVMVKVVSNIQSGPFIVAVGETRLALGRGMAHRIIVR